MRLLLTTLCLGSPQPLAQRTAAAALFGKLGLKAPAAPAGVDKAKLIEDVRQALYCSKICSYAQVGGSGRRSSGGGQSGPVQAASSRGRPHPTPNSPPPTTPPPTPTPPNRA
jgi:hypothetical protein